MGNLFRRFSDWFALFGLVFLIIGMIGTARQFKDIFMMRADPRPEGFLPITVEQVDGQSRAFAPGMVMETPDNAHQPDATLTPFLPQEVIDQSVVEQTGTLSDSQAAGILPATGGEDQGGGTGAAPSLEAPPVSGEESAGLPTVEPTATPLPDPVVPDWIRIPSIELEAPIVEVAPEQVVVDGANFEQWVAPNQAAAGWHDRSARLGEPGNVVLNGHHNIYGSVFARLKDLHAGDEVIVFSGDRVFIYVIAQVLLLEERYAPLDQRTNNAQWILPSEDTRLTLVTCWPPESNTHRLIIVARPVGNP